MNHKSSAIERVLQPLESVLPIEFAQQLLALNFSAADRSRATELSEKAQLGQLSSDEKTELEDLLTANDLLMILQAKARIALNRKNPRFNW